MAWPSTSGRMFRSRANNQHITVPPIKVSGTNTGFGQCNAPNSKPPTNAAISGFRKAASRRFVVNDCNAICCSRQNAKYPTKRFGAMKWTGVRWSAPSATPTRPSISKKRKKVGAARRVACFRLSTRHPIVFGVSRCSAKLSKSHTGKISQVLGLASCHRQM